MRFLWLICITVVQSSDFILYTHGGTKAAYWVNQKYYESPGDTLDEKCELIQVNSVQRHGTRNPSKKHITKLKALAEKLSVKLDKWKDWNCPYGEETENELVKVGVEELRGIGERMRKRFALPEKYSREKFVVEHTYKLRTYQSAMAFVEGFFKKGKDVEYHVDEFKKDHNLRFFDNCHEYDRIVSRNKTHMRPYQMVMDGSRMTQLALELSNEIGMKISNEELKVIDTGCIFDLAVFNETSQWCSLLSQDMMEALGFLNDVQTFWKKAHGHRLNWEIATPLLRSMYTSMENRILGQSEIAGHFRFAHAETLMPLISMLKLTHPLKPLIIDHTTSEQDARTRTFQTSKYVPFAGNIVFILYTCNHERIADQPYGHYKIKIMLNERTVNLQGCTSIPGFCTFTEFQTIFSDYLFTWNFEAECASTM